MKKLILLLVFIVPAICMAQKFTEVSIVEYKHFGLNVIDSDNYFIIGAEYGTYSYYNTKIHRTKYRAGGALMFNKVLFGKKNLLTTAAVCYNDYAIIRNAAVRKMPKWSIEFGIRSNWSDRLYFGLNADIVHRTGGFSIGYLIFK